MSLSIDAEIWTGLETSVPTKGNLTARPAIHGLTNGLLCAIDSARGRHLLLALKPGDSPYRDLRSRGVSVYTRELVVEGRALTPYIELVCQDAIGYAAFDIVGGEIAEAITRGQGSPDEIVRQVLAKWRRFWGQIPRQILSTEEQLGLFGELWFLSHWIIPRIPPTEALQRWRGPFGARHDFEWVGRSVEVKTTTSTRGHIHFIHGIEQLSPPESGDLLLFSLRLREEAAAETTLPGLVSACRTQIGADDVAQSMLDTSLARAGYSPAHEEEYSRLRLRAVGQGLYKVEGRFPRITPSQLADGVPDGIEQITYEINLSGFSDLCIASNPSDIATL
jgi:Putative  PD-(D/E)XK family member, (DUF4420)